MGSHEVFRCARCGNRLALPVGPDDRCSRCGTDVHGCINCMSFDTSARWECTQALTARVSPKDERTQCTLFSARTTIERQTGTTAGPPSARQAFDDLFK
jgi:DNA-directed RNA polymerase subunit RPC12/RpoP